MALCSDWITADDVAECCSAFTGGTDTAELEPFAELSSEIMHGLSGRAYGGECGPVTVRPCAESCGCWSIAAHRGLVGWSWDPSAGRWACGGRSCGCSPLSEVQLAGRVREIIEVKIDGVPLDPDEYRLDPGGRLVRMRDPAEPNQRLSWPGCQIIDLDDTEEGTFSVEYTYGLDPPESGRNAAAALACQWWAACNPSSARCALPKGTRQVARAGVTMEVGKLIAESLKKGSTGILAIDAFIAVHGGDGDEPSVWSPDLPPYPRRVGQGPT